MRKPDKGVVGLLMRRAGSRSKARKKEHQIALRDIEALLLGCDGRCAVTGMALSIADEPWRRPSLDRIDNAKGYTPSNLRITSAFANVAMNVWGEKPLYESARAIIGKMFDSVGTAQTEQPNKSTQVIDSIGAADGVRTHDNWNHNPIPSSVVALESASTRGRTVPNHSHTRQKTK